MAVTSVPYLDGASWIIIRKRGSVMRICTDHADDVELGVANSGLGNATRWRVVVGGSPPYTSELRLLAVS